MSIGLVSLLESIGPVDASDSQGLQYHVKPINGLDNHYFGRTNSGAPCLLLFSKDSSVKTPIRLASIDVTFAVPCTISSIEDEMVRTETMTAIVCTATDHAVQNYFAHICGTILQIVGAEPDLEFVVETVKRLVDLFQKLSAPARKSVIGLIGELFVIYSANSATESLAAWRSTVDDRYDFSVDDIRLEVKASGSRQRAHSFSLEQCNPPADTTGVLVSMFVESSGGGMSLLELINRIEAQVRDDATLPLKLEENIVDCLGKDLTAALNMRFDDKLAKSSLIIYDLTKIPAIRESVPLDVSQIRFLSDLTNTKFGYVPDLVKRSSNLIKLLPNWM